MIMTKETKTFFIIIVGQTLLSIPLSILISNFFFGVVIAPDRNTLILLIINAFLCIIPMAILLIIDEIKVETRYIIFIAFTILSFCLIFVFIFAANKINIEFSLEGLNFITAEKRSLSRYAYYIVSGANAMDFITTIQKAFAAIYSLFSAIYLSFKDKIGNTEN